MPVLPAAPVVVAAAVCPHPPLMIPALAGANAEELAGLRSAARSAVRQLVAAEPDVVVCVGAAPAADTVLTWGTTATGSLAAYGVDVRVGASAGTAKPDLPVAHTVGAWLLDSCGHTGERSYVGVPDIYDSARCADLGAALVRTSTAQAGRIGLLVMGDGSARRDQHAPGAADPRAPKLDALVATALGRGDLDGLRGLRPDLARELLVAGRAAWQVLAGAVEAAVAGGRRLEPRLLADEAPYGVGYFVAYWRLLG
ncbi:class III extradiol dioxygenase subunit B-like domain-containing protein [Actinopolymorpha sp. NPDC004070]|uniref:class III extradiol dioxygenase subunit B-like domain-containing protein n=1 Tax=Actinopolymorpha sp. NPDC004070 TaxID=3154548 RepID=UPI0033A01B3F